MYELLLKFLKGLRLRVLRNKAILGKPKKTKNLAKPKTKKLSADIA